MRTHGFTLHVPDPADLADVFALHADPTADVHDPSGRVRDRAEVEAMLTTWIGDWEQRGIGYWTLRAAEGGTTVVGMAGVRYLACGRDEVFNLYYRLSPSVRGRGWARAAARRGVAAAAEHDPGTPVIARMHPGNRASTSTAVAAGLRHVGHDTDGGPVLSDRDVAPAVVAALPSIPVSGSSS